MRTRLAVFILIIQAILLWAHWFIYETWVSFRGISGSTKLTWLRVIAGVLAFIMPGVTSLVLLMMIASWAMVTGIFEIVAAIQMRKYITGEWLMVLSGILSVVFGILLLINPYAGMLAIVWIVGVYALMFGILMLILGFKLRSLEHSTHHPGTPHPA